MDYIKTMRKWIGHEMLFTARCGILIENPAYLRGFSIFVSNSRKGH
ncbi:hypothetical protein ABXS71_08750 [Bacillus infantis]